MNCLRCKLITISIIVIGLFSCKRTDFNYKDSFNSTLESHFKAIEDRDLLSLLETVDDSSVSLILPNGKYSKTLEEYKSVNQEWFNEKGWRIKYEIVETIVNEKTGIALSKIAYTDKNEKGEDYTFQFYLTLIFEYKEGKWKLIFDQNTLIK